MRQDDHTDMACKKPPLEVSNNKQTDSGNNVWCVSQERAAHVLASEVGGVRGGWKGGLLGVKMEPLELVL
jgi:hypothetical protein